MRSRRRAVWIVGILGALGLILLLVLFGPGLPGRVTDRAVRRSPQATASGEPAAALDADGLLPEPSTPSADAVSPEVESPVPVESIRIEEIGASGAADRASLEVVIEDELGQPLAGLNISLHNRKEVDLGGLLGKRFLYQERSTDSMGTAAFTDLAHASGRVKLDGGDWILSADLEWPLGRVSRVTLLMPHRRSSVTGQATLKDGTPLSVTVVELHRRNRGVHIMYRTGTDERGVYLLEPVAGGKYDLQIYGDTPEGVTYFEVTIPAEGQLRRDLRVGFRSIFGEVWEASTGRAINEPQVTVERVSTHLQETQFMTGSGVFAWHDLLPGEYRLRVSHPGFASRTMRGLMVEEGQEMRVDVALEKEATLFLLAVDSGGTPLRRPFDLILRHADRPDLECTVPHKEEDEFLVPDLEPGDYELVASSKDMEPLAANVTLQEGENHCRVEFHRQ